MTRLPLPRRGGAVVACLLWIAVLVPSAVAQPTGSPAADTVRTLRLSALLRDLPDRNPTLAAERFRTDALATRARQVSAWPDPSVGLIVQPFPIETARGAQRTVWRVEQRLPTPGTRSLRAEVATHDTAIAAAETETLAQDLALQVRLAYADLYHAQAHIRVIDAFQQRLRDFEDVVTTRYEVGKGNQPSILKAQIERRRLDLQRDDLRAAEATARTTLADLLDRPPASLRGTAVLDSLAPLDTAGLVRRALQQRPELTAREEAQRRADRQIALAERAFWPDVSVSATYFDIANRDAPPTADGRDALGIGIGLSVPLSRDRLRAGVEEAEAQRNAADARLQAARSAIRTQVADLTERRARIQARLRLLNETLLPQAHTALDATRSAYSAGRSDFLDLLDAERTLFQLRRDRIALRTARHQTHARLLRAVGSIGL